MKSLINELQQLMIITSEECGELIQVCSKITRKYKNAGQVNKEWRQKLLEELGDVQCMIELMIDHGIVNHVEIAKRSNVKREKLKKWSTIINE